MNACLQCLIPIHEMRDHYVNQTFKEALDKGIAKQRTRQMYSNTFHDFYVTVFSKSSEQKRWVLDPDLKRLAARNFNPIVQHDSHEFMVFLTE